MQFSPDDCIFLVEQAHDVTARRQLELFGVVAIHTHLHIVASWRDERDEQDIQGRLKQGFGYVLATRHATKGRPYFSRGGLPEKVTTRQHLNYLLDEYFPNHHAPMWRKTFQ